MLFINALYSSLSSCVMGMCLKCFFSVVTLLPYRPNIFTEINIVLGKKPVTQYVED